MPKYGPIEYKICDLTCEMMKDKMPDWDVPRMEQAIHQSAARIEPFDSTFLHYGYKWSINNLNQIIVEQLTE